MINFLSSVTYYAGAEIDAIQGNNLCSFEWLFTTQVRVKFKIQIQNIFIEHNTWVYIENQEYETQMGLFNSTITKHHIVVFDLSFALEKTNWVSRCR